MLRFSRIVLFLLGDGLKFGHKSRWRLPAFGACSLAVASCAWCTATFQGLGDFTGGDHYSYASGISGDGSTVVGFGCIVDRFIAFKWNDTNGLMSIDPGGPPGHNSYAVASSFDGSYVVGQIASGTDYEAFRWSTGAGLSLLGDLPGGVFNSYALGVSADGQTVVGGSSSALGQEAFRWTEINGLTGLSGLSLTDFYSEARGVSMNGSVVAGVSFSQYGFEAFRWNSTNGINGIGDLAGGVFDSQAQAVSADGMVIVGQGSTTNRTRAFRWTAGTGMVALPSTVGAQGFSSIANATSEHGDIIVGRGSVSFANQFACLWIMPDRAYDLRQFLISQGCTGLEGWLLAEATGCSLDGRTIVGWGVNPDGFTEGWIAKIDDPTLRSVSGRIVFEGLDSSALVPTPIVVEFRTPGTTNVVQTTSATIGPLGEFSISCPSPPGTYDLAIKHRHWLRKVTTINVTDGDQTGLEVRLKNGDCDWSNEVNLLDYAVISIAFGKALGEPGYRPDADLDHDLEVTLVDFVVMSSNFGLSGDD